jgi:hypothetical protein
MHKDKNMSVVKSGWLVGILSATGTIVVMGLVSIGFYASFGGLLIVAGLAFMVGAGVAMLVDSRVGRNVSIVAGYIVLLFVTYLLAFSFGPKPDPVSGARGGPAVSRPR